MDFDWTDEECALRTELQDFVAQHVRPDWALHDRDMPTTQHQKEVQGYCQELAARGLLTPSWPVEYGGRATSTS